MSVRRVPLNTAQYSEARKHTGGRDPGNGDTLDWARATTDKLKTAEDRAARAMAARNASQHAHVGIDRETRQAHAGVNDRLKAKIHQTQGMKAKLEQALMALSEEMGLLAQHRQHATELVLQQQAPLAKAQHRLRMRSHRPIRENIRDRVQDALVDEAADVQKGLDILQTCISEMETTLEQMALAKSAVKN
eukprot:Hpha_TRINITY_DN13285_c0_g1::TRINITY_DN13285_c0_g1_i2::g.154917::m.154917